MKKRQLKIYRGALDSTASSTLSNLGSERTDFAPLHWRNGKISVFWADTEKPYPIVESRLKFSQVKT